MSEKTKKASDRFPDYADIAGVLLDASLACGSFLEAAELVGVALERAFQRKDPDILSYDWLKDGIEEMAIDVPSEKTFTTGQARAVARRFAKVGRSFLKWRALDLQSDLIDLSQAKALINELFGEGEDDCDDTRCLSLLFSDRGKGGAFDFDGSPLLKLNECCPTVKAPLYQQMVKTLEEESELLNIDNDCVGDELYPEWREKLERILDEKLTVERQIRLCRTFTAAIGEVARDRRPGLIHYNWFFRGLWGILGGHERLSPRVNDESRLLQEFAAFCQGLERWFEVVGLSEGDGYSRGSASAFLRDFVRSEVKSWKDVCEKIFFILDWLRFETRPTYYFARAQAYLEDHDDRLPSERLGLLVKERQQHEKNATLPLGQETLYQNNFLQFMANMDLQLKSISSKADFLVNKFEGKPEVTLEEAALYCGRKSPETIRQWEEHPEKAPAGYPGRQNRKLLQQWGETFRSSSNFRKAARKRAVLMKDADLAKGEDEAAADTD